MQELLDLAQTKHIEGYKHIILIVDLDAILTDPKELQKFKDLYCRYVSIKNDNANVRVSPKQKGMKNLMLIINNPCLEYWYIIHFKYINRFFSNFEELKPVLLKHLSDYEKSEKYYNGNPDIYSRLGGDQGLLIARQNAKQFSAFDLATCQTYRITEMDKLFDYFDGL